MGITLNYDYMLLVQWLKSYKACEHTNNKQVEINRMLRCEERLSQNNPTLYVELFTTPSDTNINDAFYFVAKQIERYLNNVQVIK